MEVDKYYTREVILLFYQPGYPTVAGTVCGDATTLKRTQRVRKVDG